MRMTVIFVVAVSLILSTSYSLPRMVAFLSSPSPESLPSTVTFPTVSSTESINDVKSNHGNIRENEGENPDMVTRGALFLPVVSGGEKQVANWEPGQEADMVQEQNGPEDQRTWAQTLQHTTTPAPPAPPPPPPHHQNNFTALGCGIKSVAARILGGHVAGSGEWPWQAALVNALTRRSFCGASLINPRYLLTAAHCAKIFPMNTVVVWLGSHDLSLDSEAEKVVQKVSHVIVHENFSSQTLANDVALLRLDEPVNMTQNIRPVCLPNVYEWDASYVTGEPGLDGTVTGWGLTEERGEPSDVLLEVSLPFLSISECKRRYEGIIPVSLNMLCTLYNNTSGISKDSCKGDSGGPLVTEDAEGRWTQIGIVSFGYGCGREGYPGVYTRVTQYLFWIYLKVVQMEISLLS